MLQLMIIIDSNNTIGLGGRLIPIASTALLQLVFINLNRQLFQHYRCLMLLVPVIASSNLVNEQGITRAILLLVRSAILLSGDLLD